MSINQFDSLKGPHRPIHAFYAPPPAGFMLTNNNDNKEPKPDIATTTAASINPTSTMSEPKLKTPVVNQMNRPPISVISTLPSSIPINRSPPPIVNQQNDPAFNSKTPMQRENKDQIPWLAPCLGVLGALGVVAICIIYFIGRNRKKKAIGQFNETYHDRSIEPGHQQRPHHAKVEQLKVMPKGYQSWASLSTINTTVEQQRHEKNMICQAPNHALPPPAYTSIRQKRMTADTLVDENNISILLKSQYAPQLAFSPSLVAGEFQLQQQLQNEDRPPLPTATISPSNTLIDNAGVLSSSQKVEHYHYSFDQRPKRIEIYEPQVNLDDPFIPYSYSNDEDEEDEEEEEEEKKKRNGKRDDIV